MLKNVLKKIANFEQFCFVFCKRCVLSNLVVRCDKSLIAFLQDNQ